MWAKAQSVYAAAERWIDVGLRSDDLRDGRPLGTCLGVLKGNRSEVKKK